MAIDDAPLPEKLFFRIGEVAALVGVEPHVLRYWEREFRTIRPTKSPKGQRVYSKRDVETLRHVHQLLHREGFTIAGAKKRLHQKDADGAEASAPSRSRGPDAFEQTLRALRVEMEIFLAELDGKIPPNAGDTTYVEHR